MTLTNQKTPTSQKHPQRKIMITCALPYANGPIHLGHMLEHIEADIFARFQRMQNNECLFICADDTHGTPIMIKARELGLKPEDYIKQSFIDHTTDFKNFGISHDHYGSTHSEENKKLSQKFYLELKKNNHISKKPVEQLYCEHDQMFLPDRFVKGTCPRCKSPNQYGDSCDVCSATYSPSELLHPGCSICGTKPVKKTSEHVFFNLNHFKEPLASWLPKHTASDTAKKMSEWFKEDLRDWDISRDEPYFGFEIPDEPKKYFYVWVDAPMGYLSSLSEYLKPLNRDISEFWSPDTQSECYHFIGKDIVYFHTLFWPAFLMGANYKTPDQVFVHGMVMVNGEKMSKSKGTFINAKTYLKHLDPQFLRYYYATKLNGSSDDLDLNLVDFQSRVNSDLVGKIVNLGSRGAQMLTKKMNSTITDCDLEGLKLIHEFQNQSVIVAEFYNQRDFSKATTLIREMAEKTNKYFDEKAPWKTLADQPDETQKIISSTLNIFRLLAIYLKPVLPIMATQVSQLFNEDEYQWIDSNKILTNHKINHYVHLLQRVDPEKIKLILDEEKEAYDKSKPTKKS